MQDLIDREIQGFIEDEGKCQGFLTPWGKPLVGFAGAGDPLFSRLKEVASPTHCMPGDLLNDAETVIVYFLPFDRSIPKSNRRDDHASREWALAYVETNRLIVDINDHLREVLGKEGYRVAPLPPTHNFDKKSLVSDWSHKHVAFIAGLGKFGTHRLLITDRGCCGRLGSIITNARIESTKRKDIEYCLYRFNGTCGVCFKKCPVGALREDAFDRHKCYELLLENEEVYKHLGPADVCGKCSSIVPCSFSNPVERLLKNAP